MTLAFFNNLVSWDALLIMMIGLLLFGKRLPEVGRGLGKGIIEFKKGLQGLQDEIEEQASKPSQSPRVPQPPPAPPTAAEAARPSSEALPEADPPLVRPPLSPSGEDV